MKYKILIVDDEQMILNMLKDHFESENYFVYLALSSEEALEKLKVQPDIILLDINLPGEDGINLCRKIRDYVSCPILFLTARIEEADKIAGFASGGDDYIVKPFSLEELNARVEAHIRREYRSRQQTMTVKIEQNLVIDYSSRTVSENGNMLPLSKTEFDIIELLSLHPGQVFSKESIYEHVRGIDGEADSNVIKEHIRRIRGKLEDSNKIETVWSVGYKWIK